MDGRAPLTTAIPGAFVRPLDQFVDGRGAVLRMLRADSPDFAGFGEVYFSVVKPGVVKAWKRHLRMTQHFAVPVGRLRLVLFDDRPAAPGGPILEEHLLGRPDAYRLVRIPPLVWYGFQGASAGEALICNCADLPHDPAESEARPDPPPGCRFAW